MNRFHVAIAVWFVMLFLASPDIRAQIEARDVVLIEDKDGAIMEAVMTPDAYIIAVTKAFYKQRPDNVDAVFIFSAIPLNFLTNVQQGWPVRQDAQGIGRMRYSNLNFGSKHVLRQAVKMGDLGQLPNNPDDLYTGIPWYALSGIELMGHEFGHQWLASITFDKGDGQGKHCFIRGWEGSQEPQPGDVMCDGQPVNGYNQHWSYYFNSGSVMYGSMWDDLGNGKYKNNYKNPKFSQLDQYLMGLRKAGEVDPMFLVNVPDHGGSAALPSTMTKGAEIEGPRLDFLINDVIRAEGERIPVLERCHWKAALILVWNQQYKPTPTTIAKVARYGQRFEEWYDFATDNRGSFDFTIDWRGKGTEGCPFGGGPGGPDEPDVADEPYIADPGPRPDVIQVEDPGFQRPDWGNIEDSKQSSDQGAREGTWNPDEGSGTWDISIGGCIPGTTRCDGNMLRQCGVDRLTWAFLENCATDGLICEDGACVQGRKGGGCSGSTTGSGTGPIALFLLMGALFLLVRRTRPAAA
jgi:hypothetical protein